MLPIDFFLYNRITGENSQVNVGVVQTDSTTNQLVSNQTEIPPAEIVTEGQYTGQRIVSSTFTRSPKSNGVYVEISKTNYHQTSAPQQKTEEPIAILSQEEKQEKAILERAVKESLEKRVIVPFPQERTIKYNDLKDCTAKAEPNLSPLLGKYKQSVNQQESSGKITAHNTHTGAAGFYGYLPPTAKGIIKQAKARGINVPYNGPMTESAIQGALMKDPKLNEFIFNFDLTNRARLFDNNPGLLAMTHYAGDKEIQKSLRIVYPNRENHTNTDVREFAFARAKGIKIIETRNGKKKYIKAGRGNSWLLKPQDYGCPSILRYAESVLGKMGYVRDKNINSIPAYVSQASYVHPVKHVHKDSQYKQKPQKKYYASKKSYKNQKRSNYKHR
jgi:hypothetical protein